ncbi:MAG: HAD hydrolase family protein [Candidatus Riflebacteria bacterium]|nr:HAD hydrolase family protein [Candidatus Riflebacteria bacterium]
MKRMQKISQDRINSTKRGLRMDEKEFEIASKNIKLLLFDCDGVLADGKIILGKNEFECKFFSTKDGMGITLWKKGGFLCGCISGRASEGLSKRSQELLFDELHQKISNKCDVLNDILERRLLDKSEVAYIGDDLNDLTLLGKVAIFLAPSDAHAEVLERADYILSRNGGDGAIREAVDLFLKYKGLLNELISTYLR